MPPRPTVYPSGGAFATASAPSTPPAPPLFSTTNDCPDSSLIFWQRMRESVSVALPAGSRWHSAPSGPARPSCQQRRHHREHRLCWQGSWRSDATLELDSLKCNWYGYSYDREQSYGECRPHHEFRRLRRRRGNDFGGNREKPPDQPGRGAEDPQAPRAGGTGRSLPRPSRRRRSPAPGISHNTRSDLQGG